MRRPRWSRRAGLLLAVALLATGCSGDEDPRVPTTEVTLATVTEVVDAPGTVGARATAALTAPADGTVAELRVRDGQRVSRGAVLLVVSSPSAQDRLRQALAARAQASGPPVTVPRADLDPLLGALDAAAAASFAAGRTAAAQVDDPGRRRRAEQQVAAAQRRYDRAAASAREALADANSSVAGLEQALSAVTGGSRAQAAAAVSAARATVDALTVRAPLAGVVTLGAGGAPAGAAGGELGGLIAGLPEGVQGPAEQALGAGGGATATTTEALAVGTPVTRGAPLLTVTDLGGLTVTAEVDETDVLLVRRGTPAEVEVDAVPGALYPGTVTAVDLAPTTSSRGGVTYRVRLDLRGGRSADDEPAPAPRPGMSAVVDLRVRTAERAVAVPAAAVVRDDGEDVVFVVEQGRAIRREVRLGAQGEDLVQVLAGLEPGARVVTRDADRLRDGQTVRP